MSVWPTGPFRLASHVAPQAELGVDDQMLGVLSSLRQDGFRDREGGAAVSESNLDHDVSVLRDKQIAKSIAVLLRKGDPLKVALGSGDLMVAVSFRRDQRLSVVVGTDNVPVESR